MSIKLSILICTIPSRYKMYKTLSEKICWQLLENDTDEFIGEVLWNAEDWSIGAKRNHLLCEAKGKYVCFVDDDDDVSSNYIQLLMEGINKGVDCCSLKGIITTDGKDHALFEHSIRYKEYKTIEDASYDNSEIKYQRYPNHLNVIKSSIAKQFVFPDSNWSEDTAWATQIRNSGLLKTEHYIEQPIYFYKFISKK